MAAAVILLALLGVAACGDEGQQRQAPTIHAATTPPEEGLWSFSTRVWHDCEGVPDLPPGPKDVQGVYRIDFDALEQDLLLYWQDRELHPEAYHWRHPHRIRLPDEERAAPDQFSDDVRGHVHDAMKRYADHWGNAFITLRSSGVLELSDPFPWDQSEGNGTWRRSESGIELATPFLSCTARYVNGSICCMWDMLVNGSFGERPFIPTRIILWRAEPK